MAAARRSSRGAPIPLAIEQLLRGTCHINSPGGGTNTSCRARAMVGRRLLRPGEQVGLIQRASRARQSLVSVRHMAADPLIGKVRFICSRVACVAQARAARHAMDGRS